MGVVAGENARLKRIASPTLYNLQHSLEPQADEFRAPCLGNRADDAGAQHWRKLVEVRHAERHHGPSRALLSLEDDRVVVSKGWELPPGGSSTLQRKHNDGAVAFYSRISEPDLYAKRPDRFSV